MLSSSGWRMSNSSRWRRQINRVPTNEIDTDVPFSKGQFDLCGRFLCRRLAHRGDHLFDFRLDAVEACLIGTACHQRRAVTSLSIKRVTSDVDVGMPPLYRFERLCDRTL